MPQYMSLGAAGMDLHADIELPRSIAPGTRVLVPCGFSMEIPEGYEAQVRPRSGLALKQGLTVLNSPGTIDSDYRGPVDALLINLGADPVVISPRDRVAQMVIAAVEQPTLELVEDVSPTERGSNGFGSSGT